jgi:histidine triad (HIT) family protein
MEIKNNQTENSCPFCKINEDRSDSVVVLEDHDVIVIMDRYPATQGHVLILPKKHIETIFEMPEELGGRIMRIAVLVSKMIKEKLSPDGLDLIQANETAAGQTIPHFHLHIVPRYKGDNVRLKFGHGDVAEDIDELRRVASLLKE